jgi:NADH-quinone oxidoreductase subunit N
MGSVIIDGPGLLLQGAILIIAIIAIFLIADTENFAAAPAAIPGSPEERESIARGQQVTEVFPLTLFAVGGMLLFPVSSDLITLFVALEVLSLPLYLMAGLSRRRRLLSQESALKYFLLGAFSSAFFLFGAAYLYGYSGSITFEGIRTAVVGGTGNDVFLLIGIAFLSIGLLFKVGAVPFHTWTPDVYQGAPTPVTAFMAAATKVAAFGAMLRIYYTSFANAEWSWRPMMIGIAIITMAFGSLVAIAQRDIKRMLAYSSIAHAGFLLTGVIALNKAGLDASIFYLFAYGVATVGAFAVVTLVRDSAGEVTDLNRWAGLSIFSAAYESGAVSVVIAGVLSSAIAAFFYIRVIVLMFFSDPLDDATSVVIPSILTRITVLFSAILTIVLGVFPSPLLDFISNIAIFIR